MANANRCLNDGTAFMPGLSIELFIPLRELSQSLSQRYLGCKPEITFKGCGICVGSGDITQLHGDELFVSLEVKVCWKDTSTYKLFLQNTHEIQQVFWLTTTDVIDCVWRDG